MHGCLRRVQIGEDLKGEKGGLFGYFFGDEVIIVLFDLDCDGVIFFYV